MTKKLTLGLLPMLVLGTAFADDPPPPISEATAIKLTPKTTEQTVDKVTLYKNGTNDEYVCYYKMTLSKGNAYTVWIDQKQPEDSQIDLIAYQATSSDWSKLEPAAEFELVQCGEEDRWIVSGKEWDYGSDSGMSSSDEDWDFDDFGDEDGDEWDWDDEWEDPVVPSTWTYYIMVFGRAQDTGRLHYVIGNVLPKGVLQNPLVIKPETGVEGKTETDLEFKSPNYYIEAKLTMGRRYYFATGGGTEGDVRRFSGFANGVSTNYLPWATDEYNESICYVPDRNVTELFSIFAEGGLDSTASLRYRVDPSRTLKEHALAGTLTAGQPVTDCKPGYLNDYAKTKSYDHIIDECLYKFSIAKNKRYVIETTGATKDLLMRIYDENGNVVDENTSAGEGSQDVRCVIDSKTKAATYYVGVCENLPEFDEAAKPDYLPVTLQVREVVIDTSVRTVNPVPGAIGENPVSVDVTGAGPNTLDATRWYDTFAVQGRGPAEKDGEGITYSIATSLADSSAPVTNGMLATVYWLSGKTKKAVAAGSVTPGAEPLTFVATANRTYYIQVEPEDGYGRDCPDYTFHALAYSADGDVGSLKVTPKGAAAATWVIGRKSGSKIKYETLKYGVGESVILPTGTYTVKYNTVKGYSAPVPATKEVEIGKGETVELTDTYYSDANDPKDDYISGKVDGVSRAATAWTLKNAATTTTGRGRTLWKGDRADYYVITPKDGYFYDFDLAAHEAADACFDILDAAGAVITGGVTSVSQLEMPASKSKKYYLRVFHEGDPKMDKAAARKDTTYDLNGLFANVGVVKFAKTSVSVKDTATSVSLSVSRTATDGEIHVGYRVKDGTAKNGEHYWTDEGELTWKKGNKKAQTVTVRLIPKLGAWNAEGPRTFTVELFDLKAEKFAGDGNVYPATIPAPVATVTITETSKATVTQESVYAKKAAKTATVKTETIPLRGGTYFGVVGGGKPLTNGLPQFASVTLTVSAKDAVSTAKDALSAKVSLAGKSYTFKTAKNEAPWDATNDVGHLVKTLRLVSKVNKVSYTNELELEVADGTPANDWAEGRCAAKLTMFVPDANAKGVQPNVVYTGDLYRQNAKVQDYLTAVVKFAGYYTLALKPEGVQTTDGIPAGNGYLTVTVDNKGKAKVAGLLPDNTKISASVTACALRDNVESPIGYDMVIPVFQAKSPYCFAAELVLTARPSAAVRPDGKGYDIVVDSTSPVAWNNDDIKKSYEGDAAWALKMWPVGGWYDTVFTLQNYYRDYAFKVKTAEITEFPKESITTTGYKMVTDVEPNGIGVDLAANAFSVAKRQFVKDGKIYDLPASVNPCNVQVKLARATGIVTGSLSVWSENADGTKQKEVSGFKHNGVLLLQRDQEVKPFGDELFTAGFLSKSLKVSRESDYNPKTHKYGTRSWTFSVPFNILGEKVD